MADPNRTFAQKGMKKTEVSLGCELRAQISNLRTPN
jgi:hypothetical protein